MTTWRHKAVTVFYVALAFIAGIFAAGLVVEVIFRWHRSRGDI